MYPCVTRAHIVDGIIGLKQREHDLALAGDSDDDSAA